MPPSQKDEEPSTQAEEEAPRTEVVSSGRKVTQRYESENEREKNLDFWINLRLDACVVLPMSMGFMFVASMPHFSSFTFPQVFPITISPSRNSQELG